LQINYCCPFWGCEKDEAGVFFHKTIAAGYEGIEIHLPADKHFRKEFIQKIEAIQLKNRDFVFITQQLTSPENGNIDSYIRKMENKLLNLSALQPSFINSHTGKDYFSFDDNCKVIEAALNISSKTGVRILHETHRGRFSFHAASLIPYLKKFPELELVGDFSHFCTVSEIMLQGQEEILEQIIPHISHMHARIGWEQGPQVNDPFAPEWQDHFTLFESWWQQIIQQKKENGWKYITITPEFGSTPYVPVEPFTQRPLSNQWDNNIYMMNKLKN
jgi:hypothetical protein